MSGALRPSGTVTFAFTDIEGSTRRWEADPEAMRAALVLHDQVLRSAIESHGGWLFKHTGDGMCAAFSSARAALDAAVAAQHQLGLPVRMGLATGEAELRGDDYFGPVLNRAARVMAAGHGGQVLLSSVTAALVGGVDLLDLGEHRLRDLSGVEHLFQVCADGLRATFPPLRTLDAVPGNLPMQATSFVGRDVEVKELCELVRAHRLVTLTGVGGVGKTRLALQAAAELVTEFPDGVWLVELAPVGDPAALPDAVATVLGVIAQAGLSVTESITRAVAGRRLLILLDNCEHVLDAAADLIEAIVAHAAVVKIVATSREGLRVRAEHLWMVPSLDTGSGAASAAVELFVDRARAVRSGFALHGESDANAVVQICRRLDGIALAIELAAARMVSMSPSEVMERLADRFRLLSGSRAGLERHQTLRQAVQWSFELLDDTERSVLASCSVFAGGFDLTSATVVCGGFDELALLDVLDSLVRKSLVTVEQIEGHTRYGLLETIRQFSEEQLAATGSIEDVRRRHVEWFADAAQSWWERSDGPGWATAARWVEEELANLRTAFRWAADHQEWTIAAAIAAHTTMIALFLQLFEPMGWAEEILPAATAAGIAQLPRVYTAAGLSIYVGRFEDADQYAKAAVGLQADDRYQPFDPGWTGAVAAITHFLSGGDVDALWDMYADLAARSGLAHLFGRCFQVYMWPAFDRSADAQAIADDTLRLARDHGHPMFTVLALIGTGRAFAKTDPKRAIDAFAEAFTTTQRDRMPFLESRVALDSAGLHILHGDIDTGLELLDTAIDTYHRAGNHIDLGGALTELGAYFQRNQRPDIAATILGISGRYRPAGWTLNAPEVDPLREVLGVRAFDGHVATGTAMESGEAVRYTRQQIHLARRQLTGDS